MGGDSHVGESGVLVDSVGGRVVEPFVVHVLVDAIGEEFEGLAYLVVEEPVQIGDHLGLDEEEAHEQLLGNAAQLPEVRLREAGRHADGRGDQSADEEHVVLENVSFGQTVEDHEHLVALGDVGSVVRPRARGAAPGDRRPVGLGGSIPAGAGSRSCRGAAR
jgi:hypothetical protein